MVCLSVYRPETIRWFLNIWQLCDCVLYSEGDWSEQRLEDCSCYLATILLFLHLAGCAFAKPFMPSLPARLSDTFMSCLCISVTDGPKGGPPSHRPSPVTADRDRTLERLAMAKAENVDDMSDHSGKESQGFKITAKCSIVLKITGVYSKQNKTSGHF